MTQFIIDFVNCENTEKLKKKKQRLESTNDIFVLVLDNLESVIHNQIEPLRKFLSQLDQECDCLKIIITTYRSIGCLDNQTFPPIKIVRKLSEIDSVSLFSAHAGTISYYEMLEFILADENFPYHEFLRHASFNFDAQQITSAQREELLRMLEDDRVFKRAFSKHDMIKQLSGNPYSIMLVAAIHLNPMISKNDKNPLVEIYNRVKSEKQIVVEEIDGVHGFENEKSAPRVYENNCSLRAST